MNNFTLCTSCSTFHALVEFLFKINRQLLEERKKQNGQQIYLKNATFPNLFSCYSVEYAYTCQ